jgi:hypothetical protein
LFFPGVLNLPVVPNSRTEPIFPRATAGAHFKNKANPPFVFSSLSWLEVRSFLPLVLISRTKPIRG